MEASLCALLLKGHPVVLVPFIRYHEVALVCVCLFSRAAVWRLCVLKVTVSRGCDVVSVTEKWQGYCVVLC